MYNHFKNLNYDKQKIIINAAIKEFLENGFDKASTNQITREANISKGSLFNYFNHKKGLYTYLIDYSIEVVESLYSSFEKSETDLFKRLENIGIQKLKFQKRFPYVFDFLISSLNEKSEEVKEMVTKKVHDTQKRGMDELYENIDYTKFKEDIDIEKAIEILTWTMFGFSDKYIEQIDSFENVDQFGNALLNEWQEYSEMLRKSFYKLSYVN